jgi:hypothetical protein
MSDRRLPPTPNQNVVTTRNVVTVGAAILVPLANAAIGAAGVPGLSIITGGVETIFQIAQQLNTNKRQGLRLASEARRTLDALRDAISRKPDLYTLDPGFASNVAKFGGCGHYR